MCAGQWVRERCFWGRRRKKVAGKGQMWSEMGEYAGLCWKELVESWGEVNGNWSWEIREWEFIWNGLYFWSSSRYKWIILMNLWHGRCIGNGFASKDHQLEFGLCEEHVRCWAKILVGSQPNSLIIPWLLTFISGGCTVGMILTGCCLGGTCYPAVLSPLCPWVSPPSAEVIQTSSSLGLYPDAQSGAWRGILLFCFVLLFCGVFFCREGKGHLPSPAEICPYLGSPHTMHHKPAVLSDTGRASSAAWPHRSVSNPEWLVQGNSNCLLPSGQDTHRLQNMHFNLQPWEQGSAITWDWN